VLESDPEYSGLDFSELTPEWNSKKGFYAYDVASLQARARWCRQWLRDRPEQEIVVVAHGDILRYITDGTYLVAATITCPRYSAH
jgi:broad specificity phosphatase PhoE